ncbi:hypothetical protein KSP39_PZI005345 [Platanthera zijinensis]|uniref:Uncharacterized protein n=1 Tax=Platanthera zijinensis TaxID=2320716 RepID=A0AAP0BTC4_9ASPA
MSSQLQGSPSRHPSAKPSSHKADMGDSKTSTHTSKHNPEDISRGKQKYGFWSIPLYHRHVEKWSLLDCTVGPPSFPLAPRNVQDSKASCQGRVVRKSFVYISVEEQVLLGVESEKDSSFEEEEERRRVKKEKREKEDKMVQHRLKKDKKSDTEDDSAIVLSKMRRKTVKGKPKKKNDKENWPIYPGRDALCPEDREMITLVMDRYPDEDSIVIERGNIFISRSSLTDILGTGWVCSSHLDAYAYVLNSLKEKDENNMVNFLFVSSNHAYLKSCGKISRRLVEHITHESVGAAEMRYLQEDKGDVLPKDIAL